MGIFTGTGLDPANDPTTDVWATTRAEIAARGLEIHGSLTKRNVKDGATAVVLKATETKSGRVVAIKVYKDPNRQVAHRNGDSVPMTNFFENERRMLAGLQSCPLVPKYYFSVAGDDATSGEAIQPFHVMEFVEGERITKFAKDSVGQNSQAMIRLFRQVLDAIDTIHRFGYLHRDLSDGNVLVDRGGNIRLIDLAEASPLGEEHTRLISTPGFGTEGVATAAQQNVRKIQTDDVRDACTIGYAMFTGNWKQDGETVADWRRNLHKAAAPDGIASIIVKGMQSRDTKRHLDMRVWNSASEVIAALDRLERTRRFRKRLVRNAIGLTSIAAAMLAFGYFAWERAQQFAYTSELRRLGEQRELLSSIPRETRADARVQQRINAAQELEQAAETANRQGISSDASSLLAQAVDKITDAARVAENLTRLQPLIEPLRKILLENDQWNRDCAAINASLTDLGTEYQEIQRQVESGDPDQAWALIAAIQPKLVQLIDDNQQSYEIADLIDQLEAQTRGLDASLTELTAFEQIKGDSSRASQYYADGKWREARAELLGAMDSMKSFLAKHETEEQRKSRLAFDADLVNSQLATNEALQREVADLTRQIADAKSGYHEVLFQGAQYKKELDTANAELADVQTQLQTAQATLSDKLSKLSTASSERDTLAKWKQEHEPLIVDYKQRLEHGTKSRTEQTAELQRMKHLLAKLTQAPSEDPNAAKRKLELAEAEQAIQQFGELKLGKKFTNSIAQEFVYLPPGEFMMGSPTNEAGRDDDETQRKVILTQGFFVATTEATQAAYSRVTGERPWQGKEYVREGDGYPAVYVSWEDVTEKFLPRLNAMERKGGTLPDGWEYRLLTEAEWEYAARAGSSDRYCLGDDESQIGEYAWFGDNAWDIGEKYAHQVATKRPNKWELFDFHGNCWEWTADIYGDYPSGTATNPLVNSGGPSRVSRGGSIYDSLSYCRSANRYRYSPGLRLYFLGFRVACVQLPSQN